MRLKNSLIGLFIIICLAGCRKEFEEVTVVETSFHLNYPSDYIPGKVASNIPVSIKNNITGEVITLSSDINGELKVNLIPGSYAITLSKSYSVAESIALTGAEKEAFVNASLPTLVVKEAKRHEIQLIGSFGSGLVIREFYYSGVPTAYFYDCFVEVYNNTSSPIRVDSLYMGNTKAASASAYGFLSKQDSVYLAQVFMVPHTGQPRYLQGGESLIISMDGINHKTDPNGNPNSPVNLGPGISDYEVFWNYFPTSRDTDAPDVPNMFHAYASTTAGFDWLPGSNGTGLVIFKVNNLGSLPTHKEPGASAATQFKAVPITAVLDAVDAVPNANTLATSKRLPVTVDAGMTTVGAIYSGKSVRRKVKSIVNGRTTFEDTNNSSNDFEVNNTPSPRNWN